MHTNHVQKQTASCKGKRGKKVKICERRIVYQEWTQEINVRISK